MEFCFLSHIKKMFSKIPPHFLKVECKLQERKVLEAQK